MSDDTIQVKVTTYADREHLVLYYVDPLTEKIKTRTAKTADMTEAQRRAAAWEVELNSGPRLNTRIAWSDFRDRYENEVLPALADKTAAAWHTAANHLERLMAPKRLSAVTTSTVSRFVAQLRAERLPDADGQPTSKPRHSPTSIATHLRHLRAALNWAVRVELLRECPKMTIPNNRGRDSLMRGRPITLEEFDRLIIATRKICKHETAEWERYQTGLWLSGLRLGESLRLSWDAPPFCLDYTRKHPRLVIYAEAHKGRRDQYLPITPDFAAFLDLTPKEERHGRVFRMHYHRGKAAAKYMTAHDVGRRLGEIGEEARIIVNPETGKFASAHDFRRAFGTRWAKKVRPATLQQLMRHRSIQTTMAYYVALDADGIADELWGLESDRAPASVDDVLKNLGS